MPYKDPEKMPAIAVRVEAKVKARLEELAKENGAELSEFLRGFLMVLSGEAEAEIRRLHENYEGWKRKVIEARKMTAAMEAEYLAQKERYLQAKALVEAGKILREQIAS